MNFYNFINEDKQSKELILNKCYPFLKDFYSQNKIMNLLRGADYYDDILTYKHIVVNKHRTPRDSFLEVHDYLNEIYRKKFGIKLRSECVFCSTNMTEVKKWYSSKPTDIYFCLPIGKYEVYWNKKIKDVFIYLQDTKFTLNIENSNILDKLISNVKFINIFKSQISLEEYIYYYKVLLKYNLYNIDNGYYYFFADIILNDKNISNFTFSNNKKLTYKLEELTIDLVKKLLDKDFSKIFKEKFSYILDNTVKGNLQGALKSKNEIMLDCKEYLLINRKWWEKNNMDEYFNEIL